MASRNLNTLEGELAVADGISEVYHMIRPLARIGVLPGQIGPEGEWNREDVERDVNAKLAEGWKLYEVFVLSGSAVNVANMLYLFVR